VLCAVPSGLASNLSLPGTHVPGYRLFCPCGTASLLASESVNVVNVARFLPQIHQKGKTCSPPVAALARARIREGENRGAAGCKRVPLSDLIGILRGVEFVMLDTQDVWDPR
jgi:hypothetical protein